MKSYYVILYVSMSFCSINQSNCIYAQPKIDSIFVKWNKKTLQSLEQQKISVTDDKQKILYENRQRSIKAYWEINSVENLNENSIRYQFLKTVFVKYNNKDSILFTLEANESGYMVTLRNFVAYIDSPNTAKIDFYTFENGKWELKGRSKIKGFFYEENLNAYLSDFGKGFNQDDIIITKFACNSPVKSEYFLPYTLANKCCFKDVIVSYKSENFIK